MAMVKVLSVRALSGHRLDLEFSDGSSGVADLSKHVQKGAFAALRDERLFRDVRVVRGAVEWRQARIGMANRALHALAHHLAGGAAPLAEPAKEAPATLRELRQRAGKTQQRVAASVEISQSALSHFEAASDHRLSVLRRYVAAIGGKLEVIVVLEGRRFPLKGA